MLAQFDKKKLCVFWHASKCPFAIIVKGVSQTNIKKPTSFLEWECSFSKPLLDQSRSDIPPNWVRVESRLQLDFYKKISAGGRLAK